MRNVPLPGTTVDLEMVGGTLVFGVLIVDISSLSLTYRRHGSRATVMASYSSISSWSRTPW